jgi:hypothetical protein
LYETDLSSHVSPLVVHFITITCQTSTAFFGECTLIHGSKYVTLSSLPEKKGNTHSISTWQPSQNNGRRQYQLCALGVAGACCLITGNTTSPKNDGCCFLTKNGKILHSFEPEIQIILHSLNT